VSKDGPLHVSEGIEVVGITWPDMISREHYALSRCGKSNDKPFL